MFDRLFISIVSFFLTTPRFIKHSRDLNKTLKEIGKWEIK